MTPKAQESKSLTVAHEVVTCDGDKGPSGHPRVFLNMKGKGEIDCPYCGRHFVLDANAAKQTAAH